MITMRLLCKYYLITTRLLVDCHAKVLIAHRADANACALGGRAPSALHLAVHVSR